MTCLRDKVDEIVLNELKQNHWNRTLVSERLKVSLRFVRTCIARMRLDGIEIEDCDFKQRRKPRKIFYNKKTGEFEYR